MSSNDQSQNPSLVSGHAQYVKGAAEVRPHPIPSPSHPLF